MRKVLTVLSVGFLLGMPAVALAGPSATAYGASQAAGHEATWWKPKPVRPVPELSVGGAGAALAVLVGGVLMMAERRRREQSK